MSTTTDEIQKTVESVTTPTSPLGKFLNSFPPVLTSILIGVIIASIYLFVPDMPVVPGAMTISAKVLATSIGVPIILAIAKGIGVNMTVVQEVVELVGVKLAQTNTATGALQPAMQETPHTQVVKVVQPSPNQHKMKRWLM